jgi:hypothetical protein
MLVNNLLKYKYDNPIDFLKLYVWTLTQNNVTPLKSKEAIAEEQTGDGKTILKYVYEDKYQYKRCIKEDTMSGRDDIKVVCY